MNLDIINGMFELFGALTIFKSCYMTYKAKYTVGISALQVAFFSSWGYFNCIFYPSLGQKFSFIAGILVAIANTVWVSQILYYRRNKNV